jgi:hypothetical protein
MVQTLLNPKKTYEKRVLHLLYFNLRMSVTDSFSCF